MSFYSGSKTKTVSLLESMNGKKHEALLRCFRGCNEGGTIARASNHYGGTTVCLRPPWILKPLA